MKKLAVYAYFLSRKNKLTLDPIKPENPAITQQTKLKPSTATYGWFILIVNNKLSVELIPFRPFLKVPPLNKRNTKIKFTRSDESIVEKDTKKEVCSFSRQYFHLPTLLINIYRYPVW